MSLISSYFILENEKKVQDERQRQKGSCFSYLFCLIIIINSFLDQCLQGLVPEVMVSGMDLFQNLSFLVLLFSTALEVFNPRDYIRQMSEDDVVELKCKV